jgi:hypothetical protein
VNLSPNLYRERGAATNFFARFMDGVRQIPGVEGVALTSKLPLDWGNTNGFAIVGRPAPDPANIPTASYRVVSPDYFRTMGIDVVDGRTFSADDGPGAPPVFIVNRAFAKAYFENQNPVGQTIRMAVDTWRIVGIVADADDESVASQPSMMIYQPVQQIGFAGRLFVRAAGDPHSLGPTVIRTVHELNADQPVERAATLEEVRAEVLSPERVNAFVFSGFAGIALLIAVVGVAGVDRKSDRIGLAGYDVLVGRAGG